MSSDDDTDSAFNPVVYLGGVNRFVDPIGNTLSDLTASLLRPEVTIGTDRRLTDEPNWAMFSSTELHAMATAGNDPAVGHDLARTWTVLGNRIGELGDRLLGAQAKLHGSWSGQDADVAGRAVSSTARYAGDTGRAAQFMGTRIGDEAYAAEAAKRLMPPAEEVDPATELETTLTTDPVPGDVASKAELARSTKEAQIRVLSSFHGSSVEVDGATPVFTEPLPVTSAGIAGRGDRTLPTGAVVVPSDWTPPTGTGDPAGSSKVPGTPGGPTPPAGVLPPSGHAQVGSVVPAGDPTAKSPLPTGPVPIGSTPAGPPAAPASTAITGPGVVAGGNPGNRVGSGAAGPGGTGTGRPASDNATRSGPPPPAYPLGTGFPPPGYTTTAPGARGADLRSSLESGRPSGGRWSGPVPEAGWSGRAGPPGPGGSTPAGPPASGPGSARGSGIGVPFGAPIGMAGPGSGTGVGEHRRPAYLIEDADVWAVNLPYTEPVIEP